MVLEVVVVVIVCGGDGDGDGFVNFLVGLWLCHRLR